jgi:hypothetical protein
MYLIKRARNDLKQSGAVEIKIGVAGDEFGIRPLKSKFKDKESCFFLFEKHGIGGLP